jgi:hypothetical protein
MPRSWTRSPGLNGEELVALADGSFRAENEGGFLRYTRVGSGWEARTPEGTRILFGQSVATQVSADGRVFAWCIERQVDKHGNAIEFEYFVDPATPAQKHLRRVRWGQPNAGFAAVLTYEEGRPDVAVNYQSVSSSGRACASSASTSSPKAYPRPRSPAARTSTATARSTRSCGATASSTIPHPTFPSSAA